MDDAGDGSAYSKVHAVYHPLMRGAATAYGNRTDGRQLATVTVSLTPAGWRVQSILYFAGTS